MQKLETLDGFGNINTTAEQTEVTFVIHVAPMFGSHFQL